MDIDQPAEQSGSGVALDPEVAALCTPFATTDPCGPDLDMESDSDYLNFFAGVEGVLPTTFFSPDGAPFDRSTVDIKGQLDAIKPLLARTRDIRLLTVQARLLILNKDLGGFAVNLAATAYWLDKFWNAVHPRPQPGDSVARSAAVGTLDLPTVVFPLQYAPLVESRRHGPISYRTWMIATGEVKPRTGEVQLPQATVTEAISTAEPEALAATRKNIALLKTSLASIRNVFLTNRESAGLDKLSALVTTIRGFIDPAADAGAPGDAADADLAGAVAGEAGPAPTSLADASQALGAIADYYSRLEPSSPILLLVRQAHHLIGKSFFEVMNILIPAQVERAAFQIGADQFFDLPLEKLSNFAEVPPAPADGGQSTEESASEQPAPRYTVTSRAQAIALLDQIHRYFRRSEPSSPVPMLCERARALAERDFMGVLRDVLPKDALRNINEER